VVQPVEVVGGADEGASGTVPSSVPEGPREPIVPLARLTSKEPSDVVMLLVCDVLFWYCLVLRLFNGDTELCGDELVKVLSEHGVSMSTSLADVPMDVRRFALNALDAVDAAGFFSEQSGSSRGIGAGVLNDVASLFELRRTGVVLALSDVMRMARGIELGDTARRRQAVLVERKLVFFLSWANERVDPIASLVSSGLVQVYKETMDLVKLGRGDGGEDGDGDGTNIVLP
jgi:hypothetical protein